MGADQKQDRTPVTHEGRGGVWLEEGRFAEVGSFEWYLWLAKSGACHRLLIDVMNAALEADNEGRARLALDFPQVVAALEAPDWCKAPRGRAEATGSEVAQLRMLAAQSAEFARNVTNQAADLKVGPHQITGPLWDAVCWLYDYGCEQVSACEALVTATEEWKPTPDAINALPGALRQYIHDLEARRDPAGEVAELTLTRDQNRMLQAKVGSLKVSMREAIEKVVTWQRQAEVERKSLVDRVAELAEALRLANEDAERLAEGASHVLPGWCQRGVKLGASTCQTCQDAECPWKAALFAHEDLKKKGS